MQAIDFSKNLTAASANNISLSQSLAGAGNLLLNGAVGNGSLGSQRRVIITSSADDHLLTWIVRGTNDGGAQIVDSFAGSNGGIAASNLDFASVTQINGSAATAGTVTAGTNTVGSSPWNLIDTNTNPVNISLGLQLVSGAANFGIEYTFQAYLAAAGLHPNPAIGPANSVPLAILHPQLQNLSANQDGLINWPARAWRLTINSGTGVVRVSGRQAGLASP